MVTLNFVISESQGSKPLHKKGISPAICFMKSHQYTFIHLGPPLALSPPFKKLLEVTTLWHYKCYNLHSLISYLEFTFPLRAIFHWQEVEKVFKIDIFQECVCVHRCAHVCLNGGKVYFGEESAKKWVVQRILQSCNILLLNNLA